MLKAIYAVDEQNGMGKNGSLPWPYNRADMKWFVDLTRGKTVIMGKATWQSVDMLTPLPNRLNIVITSNPTEQYEMTLEDFLSTVQEDEDYWIIGGAKLLKSVWNELDKVYITRHPGDYDCDVKFEACMDAFDRLVCDHRDGLIFEIWSKRGV